MIITLFSNALKIHTVIIITYKISLYIELSIRMMCWVFVKCSQNESVNVFVEIQELNLNAAETEDGASLDRKTGHDSVAFAYKSN